MSDLKQVIQESLAKFLTTCEHERVEQVERAGKWCPGCGAYFPKRGPVSVRFPSAVTMAHLFVDPNEFTGPKKP